jgi:hypothetical protein
MAYDGMRNFDGVFAMVCLRLEIGAGVGADLERLGGLKASGQNKPSLAFYP